eukprot:TRINITY_DN12171_c0_g1_i1.p2 TRINITY_DN12171_c0_g1~~TRINITY_DN12171_c0_g1_i1.p2  ORF type:complete len:414 (-),score=118.19 TRINITY_DN12171_c0_g1_i1:161-1402(-)
MELQGVSQAGLLEPSAPLVAVPAATSPHGASSSSGGGGATAATAMAAAPVQATLQAAAVPQPPQPPQQPPAAAAAAPPQPAGTATVKVVVPEGVAPGQRVAFTTPCCQNLQVTVPDGLAPGSAVRVQYTPQTRPPASNNSRSRPPVATPPPAFSALPTPSVQISAEEDDTRAAQKSWAALLGSCAFCCCCPACGFLAPLVWLWIAATYYCQSGQEQLRRPQQRMPALFSAVTCCGLTALGCLAMAGAVGFGAGASMNLLPYIFGDQDLCKPGTALLSDNAQCPFGYHFPADAESCAKAAEEVGHKAEKKSQEDCSSEPCGADISHDSSLPVCSVVPDQSFRVVYTTDVPAGHGSHSKSNKALCVCNHFEPPAHHGHHWDRHHHGAHGAHAHLFHFKRAVAAAAAQDGDAWINV